MKRGFYIFVMFFCFMASSASAQFENIGKITKKTECTRRCNIRILEVNKYEVEQIKLQEKYREAISKETDPEKLKILEASQKRELEKFHQKCEAACEDICRYNPD
ncbi:hypothetical protein KW842_18020 [Duganella sp. sic0402]|uniref:hypothetical protein n=1 Tax=Duganella sp. sic0402 TaxID=2854786 RepID=UPI001C467E36|nr:hypothetical protein [Duganella sp. sic0402]MBV7537669.1 hypothetical protein [Duganella sp. sic0402]